MAKIKKELSKRFRPEYQIAILFPDGNKIIKPKCNLEELFNTYFINLSNFLDKGFSAEELLQKYGETYKDKNIKVGINFIDSWGHKWTGKEAWPRKEKFIKYLNEKIAKI